MVAADAASTAGQVEVIGHEDRDCARSDLAVVCDVGAGLGVKIVDVHETSQRTEWVAAAATRTWGQGQLGQHGWAAQQHVVTGMALHGSPEIGALEGVLILGGANVGSTEGVRQLFENRGLDGLLEN